MISFKQKFIHIHIPRTGGTALESVLEPYHEAQRHEEGGGWWGYPMIVDDIDMHNEFTKFFGPQKMESFKHFTAQDYLDILGKEEYDKYYKFTFVRHPITRLKSVSGFNWKRPDTMEQEGSRWLIDQIYYFTDKKDNIIVDDIFKFESLDEDYKILKSKLNLDLPDDLPYVNPVDRKVDESFYKDDVVNRWKIKLDKEFKMFNYE